MERASGETEEQIAAPPVSAVTVVIPIKEIGDFVRESVAHLREDFADCEVLVLPDHDDGEKLHGASILPTWPLTVPGDKRDIAAKAAKGTVLAFLDDDAYPSRAWLEAALPHFADATIAAVGGPGVTPPANDRRQRASGWVLASVLGSGPYTYRFRPGRARDVEDYPSMNLLVRRDDFEAVGGFDSIYWPGEDSEFCQKLVAQGKRIVYEPRAIVYHHRRALFRPHLRQQGRYGVHRGHFARRFVGNSRRIAYLIPTVFTVWLVSGPVLAVIWSPARILYAASVGSYLVALLATAAWVWRHERDVRVAALTFGGLFATHVTYGLCYVKGLLTPRLAH
jgi:hypothetical protein